MEDNKPIPCEWILFDAEGNETRVFARDREEAWKNLFELQRDRANELEAAMEEIYDHLNIANKHIQLGFLRSVPSAFKQEC